MPSEIPADLMAKAWEAAEHITIMSLISQRAEIIAQALLAERERCAKLCEGMDEPFDSEMRSYGRYFAKQIRDE